MSIGPPKHDDRSSGRIEIICGPMFSGKTEELIRRLKRAYIAKQGIVVFKPKMDKRYDKELIVSHDSNKISSIPINGPSDINDHLGDDINVIGIDEGQFFNNDLPGKCDDLANKGFRVIISGLDKDHRGTPFDPMPNLMAKAEHVDKVQAICLETGGPAYFSYKKEDDGERINLGGDEKYIPLSREAFYKYRKNK